MGITWQLEQALPVIYLRCLRRRWHKGFLYDALCLVEGHMHVSGAE